VKEKPTKMVGEAKRANGMRDEMDRESGTSAGEGD